MTTRLNTARKLCLIRKSTAKWIEPLLYRSAALATEKTGHLFRLCTQDKKPQSFYLNMIEHCTSFTMISFQVFFGIFDEKHTILDFRHVFTTFKFKSLEELALRGSWCLKIDDIPFFSPILDLTFIGPDCSFEHFPLQLLSLRSFHIIGPSHRFSLKSEEDGLHLPRSRLQTSIKAENLEAIPRICLDFTYTETHLPG